MLEVAEVLRGAERISAFCHENPDGDTLGAAIAIAMAAERLGKQAEVVSGDPPPPFLAFLPGVERVRAAGAGAGRGGGRGRRRAEPHRLGG